MTLVAAHSRMDTAYTAGDATPYFPGIRVAVIIMFCVIPMIAWATTLIAMRGYSLTGEKMKQIQAVNAKRKEAVPQGASLDKTMKEYPARRTEDVSARFDR